MKVLKRMNVDLSDYQDITLHSIERTERLATYNNIEKGKYIAAFIVDKQHPNGLELHVLYSNRLIKIYNYKSRKHITTLYARKGQIKRYFKNAPMHLFDNFKEGLNEI